MPDFPRVSILRSHPDERLHGYVGEVLETVDRQFRVRFLIKIDNRLDEAMVPIAHCAPIDRT